MENNKTELSENSHPIFVQVMIKEPYEVMTYKNYTAEQFLESSKGSLNHRLVRASINGKEIDTKVIVWLYQLKEYINIICDIKKESSEQLKLF